MSSSPSPTDYNGALAKRHSTNGGGVFAGFLSSWMDYFNARQYESDVQQMFAQNQLMMERMERLMNKLEEKLESLEDRERNIGEGRNIVKGAVEELLPEEGDNDGCDDEGSISSEDLKRKGESLQAYQDMVATNRTDWIYCASDYMEHDPNLDEDEEYNILRVLRSIKKSTFKMRRGEYHFGRKIDLLANEPDFQGIRLEPLADESETSIEFYEYVPYHINLRPHWEEFVDALDDFDLILDVMPDDAEPCFQISQIELPVNIFMKITKALDGKSFLHYKFENNDFGRYGVLAVMDLLDNNQHLQSLTLSKNFIDEEDEDDFCEAIKRHPTLSAIHLNECLEERMFILGELVQSNQLVEISMRDNYLSFDSPEERQDFTNALVSNKSLEKLDLTGICLNDEGLKCFTTLLESNSVLKCLCLDPCFGENHHFTDAAAKKFGDALRTNSTLQVLSGIKGCYNGVFDDSNLNSAADSNHTCYVQPRNFEYNALEYNEQGNPTGNRQRKIYNILARRHLEMCNVQHFDDIGINLLPDILAAVQYYKIATTSLIYEANERVSRLSITFEIMRKWDKALSLYKNLSENV
eukprot:scaffold4123_cov145-Skeletonema_menzelii.AAC.3